MALVRLKATSCNIFKSNHVKFCRSIGTTKSLLCVNRRILSPNAFKEKEKRFLEKDKVPQDYHLIYKAPMESYVAWATHVSSVTAFPVGICAIFQFFLNKQPIEALGELTIDSEDLYYFAAGFVAINAILRLVVFVFALRIYKNEGKYIAVYHSQLPFTIRHHVFKKGEVKEVHYRLSPWNNISYMLGGKTSLILEDYFKTPSEFHEMRNIKDRFIQE